MTTPRLTPTQRRVLERMAEGSELIDSGGGRAHIKGWHTGFDHRVATNTALSLLIRGWAYHYGFEWPHTYYRISPAGRAALEATE